MTPGEYPGLPMADYLRLPAVSASIVQACADDCPRMAWEDSWLNPNLRVRPTDEADIGTIAHSMLLESGPGKVAVIDPLDHPAEKGGGIPVGWTNKSIRAARDAAREAGLIPVLAPQMAEIGAMANAAREYIESIRSTEPAIWRAFQADGGDSELTLTWLSDGILCRMRPDRISKGRDLIINYKTTSGTIEPERWGRGPFLDYYVGAAWYVRGLRTLALCEEASYVYLVQSTAPPYLCSMVGVNPAWLALGDGKCRVGLRIWQTCARENRWPGYPTRVAYPEMLPWELQRFEDRQVNDPTINYGAQG